MNDQIHLSRGNRPMYGALTAALSAIFHLDDAGSTVTAIDVRGSRPVLTIDKPPAFVRGVATVTQGIGGERTKRMAANFHGVQIEWTEPAPAPVHAAGACRA